MHFFERKRIRIYGDEQKIHAVPSVGTETEWKMV